MVVAFALPASAWAPNMEPGSGAPYCWAGYNYGASIWYGGQYHWCSYYGWSPPL